MLDDEQDRRVREALMAQNNSSAVMQQRHPVKAGEFGPRGFPVLLDYFPTPPWAARAACAWLTAECGESLWNHTCWEPACGEGHLAVGLRDCFRNVIASDVYDYGGTMLMDFLQRGDLPFEEPEWIFTNPPFRLAAEFVSTALRRSKRGVVMFVRSAFTEGDERLREIFQPFPPSYVVTYSERVVLLRDRLIQANALDPWNLRAGKPQRASSATSYALIVWRHGDDDTRHRWIARCRQDMERAGDYPAYAERWAEISQPIEGGLPL